MLRKSHRGLDYSSLNEREQRAVGSYLGLAIGDALGATVEFMTPREIETQYGVHDRIVGGGWLGLKPGTVTDDTTMALALGDAIISADGIDAQTIGHAFDQWMRAKPVDIGHTVRRGIRNFRLNGETAVPLNDHDAGNGACMRVLPIALATLGQGRDEVDRACQIQSHITHHNPLSDAGTLMVVECVQLAINGGLYVDLLQGPINRLIEKQEQFTYRKSRQVNPSGYIVHTLQAVLQSLYDTDNFRDCLIDVVNRGGDADTTGAIAGMIAGAMYGVGDLPGAWLKQLDKQIATACEHQALTLIALSGS